MKKRTRARELALQFLYQIDLRDAAHLAEAARFLKGEEPDQGTRDFALQLVRGTIEHAAPIDCVISEVAQNWDIARMAVIDRNVLRMATFELMHCVDIPPKVSINEAIELGKRFSTQNSGGFINGVLDKIKARFAPVEKGGAGEPVPAGSTQAASGEPTAAVAEPDPGSAFERPVEDA